MVHEVEGIKRYLATKIGVGNVLDLEFGEREVSRMISVLLDYSNRNESSIRQRTLGRDSDIESRG